mgnify:CR=1 FL=1
MGDYLNKICTLPLDEVLRRGSCMIRRRSESKLRKWRAEFCATYSAREDLLIEEFFLIPGNFSYKEDAYQTLTLAQLYLEHKFDLLGSGWRNVRYGMKALGVEGHVYPSENVVAIDSEGEWLSDRLSHTNLSYAKKIWKLVNEGYEPIPWQMDFKSGYTWSAKTWYTEITYGKLLGVDIKVPWELSRMQHLPMLARAYRIAAIEEREKYAHEFRNEILDFIATNPPQFGVNWRCTMDVGIRVANWLVAYDLFKGFGASFDEGFECALSASVYDHGRHILRNLEYSPELRSNHYLSDIVGLLFASLHLPATDEMDAWLAFSLQEIVSEMRHEFHEDGTNFEGSTSYHCLSTELMLYGALFAVQMRDIRRSRLCSYKTKLHHVQPRLRPLKEQDFDLRRKEIFPGWFWERLAKALRFTSDLLHKDGTIPQIGDNDSGRFLKLNPVYEVLSAKTMANKYVNLERFSACGETAFYDEDILDHENLRLAYAILSGTKAEEFMNFEITMIQTLAKDLPKVRLANNALVRDGDSLEDVLKTLSLGSLMKQEYQFPKPEEPVSEIYCYPYTGMGLYIFKSTHLYMTVRCGEVGQKGNGGHAHNDQLSVTLQIDGVDVIMDPGTYLYTPLPDRRNAFRSTAAHFTVQKYGAEQNPWVLGVEGLFSVAREETFARVLFLTPTAIVMEHSGFGNKVYRVVEILENKVYIRDYGSDISRWMPWKMFSNGYGKCILENNL